MINFLLTISPEGLVLQHHQYPAVLRRQNAVSTHPLAELDVKAAIIQTGSQESLG